MPYHTMQVIALEEMAKERFGCSVGQLALAWCLRNRHVSTVLLGATRPEQLTENLGAVSVARRITAEDMARISAILANDPAPYSGYGGEGARSIESLED
jgi:aryl-alcohol dehydrogenase-like predicted oxidoreductase